MPSENSSSGLVAALAALAGALTAYVLLRPKEAAQAPQAAQPAPPAPEPSPPAPAPTPGLPEFTPAPSAPVPGAQAASAAPLPAGDGFFSPIYASFGYSPPSTPVPRVGE